MACTLESDAEKAPVVSIIHINGSNTALNSVTNSVSIVFRLALSKCGHD